MRKFILAATAILLITPSLASAASVANLTGTAGTVLVDQGNGFAKVSGDMALPSGSRVLLSHDGRAEVAYVGHGACKIALSANTITTVTSAATDCTPKAQVAGQANPPPQPQPGTIDPLTGLVVLGTAGTIGTAFYFISQNNNGPASF